MRMLRRRRRSLCKTVASARAEHGDASRLGRTRTCSSGRRAVPAAAPEGHAVERRRQEVVPGVRAPRGMGAQAHRQPAAPPAVLPQRRLGARTCHGTATCARHVDSTATGASAGSSNLTAIVIMAGASARCAGRVRSEAEGSECSRFAIDVIVSGIARERGFAVLVLFNLYEQEVRPRDAAAPLSNRQEVISI